MLKTFALNYNLSVVDRGSAGNLVHEAATRARKRLREMIGEETSAAAASTSKTMTDVRSPHQLWAMKEAQFPTITKLSNKYLLPVQAMSASSERIFPAAGNTSEMQPLDLRNAQVPRVPA